MQYLFADPVDFSQDEPAAVSRVFVIFASTIKDPRELALEGFLDVVEGPLVNSAACRVLNLLTLNLLTLNPSPVDGRPRQRIPQPVILASGPFPPSLPHL